MILRIAHRSSDKSAFSLIIATQDLSACKMERFVVEYSQERISTHPSEEVLAVSQEQIAIADMQCWVFRKAQSKWNLSPKECMDLFKKYDLLGFISECYGLLHVSGYQHALEEVEEVLHSEGVNV